MLDRKDRCVQCSGVNKGKTLASSCAKFRVVDYVLTAVNPRPFIQRKHMCTLRGLHHDG